LLAYVTLEVSTYAAGVEEEDIPMRLFGRRRRSRGSSAPAATGTMDRAAEKVDRKHLEEFASSRNGVEGFVEPRTTVTETTLLLVAIDGEWTRRRVPSAQWAHDFCNKSGLPSYDAAVVGYPQRMREYNRRQSQARKAAEDS
jgi:hypothetical protein